MLRDLLKVFRKLLNVYPSTVDPRVRRRPSFKAVLEVLEDRAVPAILQATSGTWLIEVDSSSAMGLKTWQDDRRSDPRFNDVVDHMFQEAFWYRVGDTGPERSISSLTANSATANGNRINVSYGSAQNGDPIRVDVNYTLTNAGLFFSSVDEIVTVTNLSSVPRDVHLFMYTDFDLDGTRDDDTAVQVNGFNFTQRSSQGNLTAASVTINGGALPTRFQMGQYPALVNLLNDSSPTTLTNSPTTIGPDDATQAFQWDLNNLAAGQSVVISINKHMATWIRMPTTTLDGPIYVFESNPAPVVTTEPYDPVVAVGYDYEVTSGPNFSAVSLPLGYGDDQYTLFVDTDPNTPGIQEGVGIPLAAGVQFNFTSVNPAGVSAFRVRGIEPAANVNPNDQAGFITNLAFVNASAVQFTMTPLTDNALDFGDAPDTYSTLLASNGARHEPTGPRLGSFRDQETDAHAPLNGLGDLGDDGVVLSPLYVGRTATATVEVAGGPARLDAWIDFNRNGTFETGERITPVGGTAVVSGSNVLSFPVPDDAVLGSTFARFRLSTAGGLAPTGAAVDGEVEDYAVTLQTAPPLPPPVSVPSSAPVAVPHPITAVLLPQRFGKKQKMVVRVQFTGGRASLQVVSPFQKPNFTGIAAQLHDADGDGTADSILFTGRQGKKSIRRIVSLG